MSFCAAIVRSLAQWIDSDHKEAVGRALRARRRDGVQRTAGPADRHGWIARNLLSKTGVFC